MRRQGFCRSVMWEPGSLPRMTQGLPSSRGRSASTARASGPSGTTRPPHFVSGMLLLSCLPMVKWIDFGFGISYLKLSRS